MGRLVYESILVAYFESILVAYLDMLLEKGREGGRNWDGKWGGGREGRKRRNIGNLNR